MTSITYNNKLNLSELTKEFKTSEEIEKFKTDFEKLYNKKFKIEKLELREIRGCKYLFISDNKAILISNTGCKRILSTGNLCGNNKYLGDYCKNCSQLIPIWE